MNDLNNILFVNKIMNNSELEIIKCDDIPMCNECLFEIKDGIFLCYICKNNFCEIHLKKHDIKNFNHKIFKLEKNK